MGQYRAIIVSICFVAGGAPLAGSARAQQSPAINPFGPRRPTREDAKPGYAELSDGSVHVGRLYLTRDARLEIFDEQSERRREIPWSAVKRIECKVAREWMEREWRFREAANNQKVYTGRAYPARLYAHTITLRDGRRIVGPLSALVYVQDHDSEKVKKLLLHKRQKGPIETGLKSLLFVRTIELGEEALEIGKEKAKRQKAPNVNGLDQGAARH
jgi:hypothetical protein